MTQHEKYDAGLLDYLYEEMSAEDAAAFAEHVAGCAECQGRIGDFQRVRGAVRRELSPAPDEDQMLQRLGSQILYQAALLRPPAASASTAAPGSTEGAEGKVLPFHRRRPMSFLFHPATGIMAAAAITLLLVVVRDPSKVERPPLEPPPGLHLSAPAATAVAADTKAEEKAAEGRVAAEPPGTLLEAAKEAPRGTRKAEAPMPARSAGPAAKLRSVGLLPPGKSDETTGYAKDLAPAGYPKATGRFVDAERDVTGRRGAASASAEAPATPAADDVAPQKEEAAYEQKRPAPAPPPILAREAPAQAPMPAPGAAHAQTRAKGKSANIDSLLETETVEGSEALRQQAANARRNDLNNMMNQRAQPSSIGAGAGGGNVSANGSAPSDAAAPLLQHLREHLKAGRCPDAAEVLARLDQSFAGSVPAEDRGLFHRVCPAPAEQQSLQTQQLQQPARSLKKSAPARPAKAKPSKAAY